MACSMAGRFCGIFRGVESVGVGLALGEYLLEVSETVVP